MADWDFQYSIFSKAKREDVWNFMSDMSNQVRMEAAVEHIELDGPFETGGSRLWTQQRECLAFPKT